MYFACLSNFLGTCTCQFYKLIAGKYTDDFVRLQRVFCGYHIFVSQMILSIAIPTPLRRTFDYLLPSDINAAGLQPGMRVKVPFGRRELVGLYLRTKQKTKVPSDKLKSIISVLDDVPVVTEDILALCHWASDYYHHALGDVLSHALPISLRQGKQACAKVQKAKRKSPCAESEAPILNAAQHKAVTAVVESLHNFNVFLLDGVTGSGKTEVYLKITEQVLQEGRQALVLVPEIGLTPQILHRFQARFSVPIVNFHSKLNHTERLYAWLAAKSGHARIIIGTRSAIFTPCQDLGVIIVDEEHDMSFKQQSHFRYSARDLAVIRAQHHHIPIVLGSATPALETLYNAKQSRYHLLHLPERAGSAVHPKYGVIDIRNARLKHGLSTELTEAIRQTIEDKNQVLLFLNRRGYAPTLMCHACGWIAKCKRCDAHMTLHRSPAHLRCHHCDTQRVIDTVCPLCGYEKLRDLGVGTERLEKALIKLFPEVPVVRIDRDTTRRKHALTDIFQAVHQGAPQILVGTQMIAKGHHFPDVTLVGIINIDNGFFSSDFRTTERMAQLMLQVAGRSGRAEKPGEVLIQTHHPDHPLLLHLIQKGYGDFAQLALLERAKAQLPPYIYFALFRAKAFKEEHVLTFLNAVKEIALQISEKNIHVLGPVPSPMLRRQAKYHMQLLLQSKNRRALHAVLQKVIPKIDALKISNRVQWSLDIDPVEMY